MRRILVTGASGFAGRNIAAALARRGHRVTALIRREAGFAPPVEAVRYDDADPASLASALARARPDAVVHAAGLVNGPDQAVRAANLGFTRALVDAVEAARLAPDICFVSSVSAIARTGVYGAAKQDAEDEIARRAPARFVALRSSLIHGAGATANVGALIRAVRYWPVVPVVGGRMVKLQPLYVDDLTDAIAAVVEGRGAGGARYIVAGPRQELLYDMIGMIQERVGRRAPRVPVPLAPVKLAIGAAARLLPFLDLPVQQVKALSLHPMYRSDEAARDLGFAPRTFAETIPLYL